MKYSRWAASNKEKIAGYGSEQQETSEMSNDARNAAVRGLIDKARVNRGEQSESEKQRANAVAVLAGKQPTQKPLRPEVRDLLNGGRR